MWPDVVHAIYQRAGPDRYTGDAGSRTDTGPVWNAKIAARRRPLRRLGQQLLSASSAGRAASGWGMILNSEDRRSTRSSSVIVAVAFVVG